MASGPSPPATSSQPAQQVPAFKPNYDILSSMNLSRPASQSSTPAPSASPQVRATATPPQAADPFAALVSASPRPNAGGFQPPQGHAAPASSSLLDLAGGPAAPPQPTVKAAAEEDEWNFASSLPQNSSLPATNQIPVLDSQLHVEFQARRNPAAPRQIYVKAVFSNKSSQPISELHFQVAVEKVSQATQHPSLVPPLTALGLHAVVATANGTRHCPATAAWSATGDGVGWH